MTRNDIKYLFYLTHVDNIPSIVQNGILSHEAVEREGIEFTPIYDQGIVSNRQARRTPSGKSLWEYADLYFQPRNPMMYRVVHEKQKGNLAVVAVRPKVMDLNGVVITDGNAANTPTLFYDSDKSLPILSANWKTIQSEWWNQNDGSKRKIMAECLVPNRVSPEHIDAIFVANHEVKESVEAKLGHRRVTVIPEPRMFFEPNSKVRIGKNISLVDGDMFFSNMQTLTVSVNTKSIMGKGLASRAKYQFPDVYVVYQDACKSKKLRVDRPYLYKRESSMDEELADLDSPLTTPNAVKWFLLFATKRDWRHDSRMEDIEAGLQWVRDHAKEEGVLSLALPALGCGLGNLEWADVGPLMCRYLHDVGFDVAIYLPQERGISDDQLKAGFLLR